ncbi:MAG: hypothetical protein AB8G14_18505 [Ilumatobacter sp.]
MNAYSRTLPLPGVARPVREVGSSALDRAATTWPAPDPSARVLDTWAAPVGAAVFRVGVAPWPAPDPVMRFDLPAPAALGGPRTELIEPTLPVAIPNLQNASLRAISPIADSFDPLPTIADVAVATEAAAAARTTLPPPVLADAASIATVDSVQWAPNPVVKDRSGVTTRLVVGLAAAAGVVAAGTVALFAIF